MAPKRPPPVEDPPSASSSEEEEEETSSGEEEEVSDDEQNQPPPPQPQTKTTRTQKSTPKNPEPSEVLRAELDIDVGEDRMEGEMERHSSVKKVSEFYNSVSVSGMDYYVVRRGLDFVHGRKKAEMKEKWRKLRVAELELFLKRKNLIEEQAMLMLSAFKSQSSSESQELVSEEAAGGEEFVPQEDAPLEHTQASSASKSL